MPDMDISQRFNIGAELIEQNLRAGRGDAPAIWSGGKILTYRDVEALTDRLASALLRAGVKPEQRVLFVLPDSPELAAGYLAAMKIGAVAVPCNPLLRSADYAYFVEESRARLLITSRACIERVEPALSGTSALERILVVGESGDRSFERWVADTPAQKVTAAATRRDEPAFWLWTSGSTGRPKAAVHAHQDWPHCCELYARGVLGLSAVDRCFSASKLFHAYGLGNGLVFPFWVGASTVLAPDRPTPDVTYRILQEAKPTVFYGVPTLYAAMLAQKDVTHDLSSLRLCVSAGEPLPGELFTRWKTRFGTEILDGIGSTEVLHIYVSPRRGQAKPDSTGKPVDGYEVRIIDENGAEVPRGETGDLIVRGPSTATMYFNRLEQTRSKMRGEWFFTGDKFRQTEDGEFHYVGRSDDMFKAGAEWVSPTDVEAALVSHAAVLEAAVTPRADGGLLRPQAHVVLTEGRPETPELAEELRQHVRSRCAGYMVPKQIHFVKELPKTATGKIQRYLLRGETP
ncbi:MAG: benzoate-CoA ligase family protein [Deltaproteobacteria bacterium]|nr:MAG: benzoate-CoA ligase family protein [Deltaproteobacteria bacterium]